MTLENAVLVLRVFDAVLAAVCIALIVHSLDQWHKRSANNRFVWGGILMLLVANLYTSIEQVVEDAAAGLRGVITLVALIYLLLGLFTRARAKKRQPHVSAAADD